MKQNNVVLSHPLYIGATILELSKRYNYKAYYEYFTVMYKEIKLIMHDTDCFLVLIRGQDPYEDMEHNMKLFDTSNFPEDHFLFSEKNRKKLGTFKAETGAEQIKAVCALRSKSYCILLDRDHEIRKSKGIKKHLLAGIAFQDYFHALHSAPQSIYTFQSIRSIKNNLFTVRSDRAGLSPMDDKRYICSNGIDTLPYGHWRIVEGRQEEVWF